MGDGTDGADMPDLYTVAKTQAAAAQLDQLTSALTLPAPLLDASDCGGGWQVYLRQSIPGLGNRARDTTHQPMKNWWPFMFY